MTEETKISFDDVFSFYIALPRCIKPEKEDEQINFLWGAYSNAARLLRKMEEDGKPKELINSVKSSAENILEIIVEKGFSSPNEIIEEYERRIRNCYPTKVGGGVPTKEMIRRLEQFVEQQEGILSKELITLGYMLFGLGL